MNYLQKKKFAFMSIVNRVKGFIRTITGALPLTLEGCVDEESIIDYTLYGQSVQNGTPTPDTPIEVESVGEKTRNLITANDGYIEKINEDRYVKYEAETQIFTIQGFGLMPYVYFPETIPSGTTTSIFAEIINDDYEIINGTLVIGGYGVSPSWQNIISFSATSAKKQSSVFTTTADANRICIYVDANVKVKNVKVRITYAICDTAFTEYEPYGYKIPITVNGKGHKPITTNIYLDEPLRKVGDYADYIDFENGKVIRQVLEESFDGSESWYLWETALNNHVKYALGNVTPILNGWGNIKVLSNMFMHSTTYEKDTMNAYRFPDIRGWIAATVDVETFPNVEDFKNFLSTQSNVNKPLKVYFAMPKKETPLTLPIIPTFKGTSIISVDTTIQPSNAEIEYYSNAKER